MSGDVETAPAAARRSASPAARPSGVTLGDAVAGAHGAKDTASEPARAEGRQPAAHLLEQAEHHEHPEDDEQHAGPDLDGPVVPLDDAEARVHPVEGQGGEDEGHAQADRVDEQKQRSGQRRSGSRRPC